MEEKKLLLYHYLASTLETTPHVMSLIKERDFERKRNEKKKILGERKCPDRIQHST